jgi:Flp pilus assembly secretin CpaC
MNEIGERRAADPAAEAAAQEGEAPYVDPAGDTHPALFLTPDKSRIIRLEKPASTVVVGNVAHVNVLIDSPHTLVVVPRQTGASYFTVMDENRRVIMQRHVIVGPAPQYVRVRRSCGNSAGCEETSVFYCPNGMCHQVTTMQQPGNAPTQTTIAGSTGGGVGSMGGSEMGTETYEGGMPFGEFPSIPFIPFPFSFPGTGGE